MSKTYYMQIKKAVLPHLAYCQEGLLKLDRASLRGYRGEFLHASRNSGTDLELFDNIETLRDLDCASTFALRESNTLFLHGLYGQVKAISRVKALTLMQALAKNLAYKKATLDSATSCHSTQQIYKEILPNYLALIPNN